MKHLLHQVIYRSRAHKSTIFIITILTTFVFHSIDRTEASEFLDLRRRRNRFRGCARSFINLCNPLIQSELWKRRMLRRETFTNPWGGKTTLGPGSVDTSFGSVSMIEVMLGKAIFRFARVSRNFDVGGLDDKLAQNGKAKFQDNRSETLVPRFIFVNPTVNLKQWPFKPLRLERSLCTRYF